MKDFTDILAAMVIMIAICGLIFFPAAALHIRKLRKALEDSRNYARCLEETLAGRRHAVSALRRSTDALTKELMDAIEWNALLLQEIEERKALPLRGVTDEELVEVVRKELTHRVEDRLLVEYAFGPPAEPIWKIASKVGGAAFRVVDTAKRGKLFSEV